MRRAFSPERIVEIAEDIVEHADNAQTRLQALQMIADRAHGKVTDRTEVALQRLDAGDDDDVDLSLLTDAQLAQLEEIERQRDALLACVTRALPPGPSDA